MGIESLLAGPFIWIIVAAIAALIEVASVSLITVWFVIGGLAAFFVGYFGGPILWQLVAFLVVSLVCLALFRPMILKYRAQGESHEATLIGQEATVVETVGGPTQSGRVQTQDRVTWTAFSSDGGTIQPGERVKIVRQESIKLYVERA